MTKKKEENLSYLQMPLPSGTKYSKMTKRVWGGLNKRQTMDTGLLTMAKNISTKEYPYLTPSEEKIIFKVNGKENNYSNDENFKTAICMYGFDNFIVVVYSERIGDAIKYAVKLDYITMDEKGKQLIYTVTLQSDLADEDKRMRSIVQFNVCTDANAGTYEKKLVIFPDKKSVDFYPQKIIDDKENNKYHYEITAKDFDGITFSETIPEDANTEYIYRKEEDGTYWHYNGEEWKEAVHYAGVPDLEYAVVHLSRIFGVKDGMVYASAFNNYTNWETDVTDYNESNAWCSTSQSNTKADGNFTGITAFQNHIVCFKKDFMHELYNNKNPFRIQDIYAEGTIDNRTIQDVDGKLIFVSEDNVKVYTGGNPRILSYNLNFNKITEAVSGTDGRNYYLFCNDNETNHFYVYDTYTEQWTERDIEGNKVISFAKNDNGMYMLCNSGCIYKIDTDDYPTNWSFETDLITAETVDIKHIRKVQLLADIDNGATLKVYVLYDNKVFDEGASQCLYDSNGETGKKIIRVKPRQTAHYGFKFHISGSGYVKLYELEIHIQAGGELYDTN